MLKNDYQLYTGDTLITAVRSRVSTVMNDESAIAISPNTKLVIDKSVYDPEKDERSSLLSLLFGRARFIVNKIAGKPSFTVNTPTSVCGVRGSDFAISVSPAEKQISSIRKFFKKFSLVKEAHAQIPGLLISVVVTGEATTVSFVGSIGAVQTVAPLSVCAAVTGGAAITPVVVGAAAAATLSTVGPGLAALSMPPHFD
ncbi:FecR domain-containing protein [Thermodesulfobacteriota bacterium]